MAKAAKIVTGLSALAVLSTMAGLCLCAEHLSRWESWVGDLLPSSHSHGDESPSHEEDPCGPCPDGPCAPTSCCCEGAPHLDAAVEVARWSQCTVATDIGNRLDATPSLPAAERPEAKAHSPPSEGFKADPDRHLYLKHSTLLI